MAERGAREADGSNLRLRRGFRGESARNKKREKARKTAERATPGCHRLHHPSLADVLHTSAIEGTEERGRAEKDEGEEDG